VPEEELPEQPEPWVWLARVRRAQGRKGEVFADLLTDFPEKFAERDELWLVASEGASKSAGAPAPTIAPRAVELTNHWLHKGGIVLHFAGVDSIGTAELLAGLFVAVPRSKRVAPGKDEAYIGDIVGCILVDVAGAAPVAVGEVEDVDRSAGPVPLLVVRGAKGEVLIPYAESYLRKLDLEGKRIEMALPEGLVDLNAADI
jgi:16S rRNA processing protein RimM